MSAIRSTATGGVSDQLIQRRGFAVTGQPRVLDVAALQQAAYAAGDLLHVCRQWSSGFGAEIAKHGMVLLDEPVQKLCHEVGQRTMEDAGLPADRSRTARSPGTFVPGPLVSIDEQ